MKKIYLLLSILLLSILLCFGFVLRSEVHASGPKILQENTYLTFQSTSSFTLSVYDNTKHWDGTLYYSTDTITWNVWDGTTILSSVNNKLYLRGTGNTRITGSSDNYRWVLAGSNIECIGNIENLLDYETVALGNHPTMTIYCYRYMFKDCTGLTTAPSLPATTLADYCYYAMFFNCISLTTVPSLPATTLADYCYSYMFSSCTALKVSTTQTESYQYTWRIPTSGMGTTATSWNTDMLKNTGGTFKGNPTIDTTYYVENPPVSGSGFNITFEENGGSTISDIEEAIELPSELPIPTKSGYTFLGWYYDSDFTNEAFAGDPLSGDVVLYAKWVLNTYTIIFEENGGSTISDIEEAIELPSELPIPTKSGYTFLGWYYDSDFTNEAFAGDLLTGDVTLYAMWGEKNKMTDITILIIGLIIFIIANILGFIYKNNLLTALSGLLWLLPIFLVDNAIIKIFSIIIMLITFLFSFKERDDYYYD